MLRAERLADGDGALKDRGGRREVGPEPLGGLGRRERVRQKHSDRGPVGVVLGRARQRCIHQEHGGLGAGVCCRLVEYVARNSLDQTVGGERAGIDSQQAEPAERFDRSVALEIVLQALGQGLRLGAEQVAWNGVRGEEDQELQQLARGRAVAGRVIGRSLPSLGY
jgi:hypothetical protein